MAANQQIIENVKQVRNATYGKDVREAIARALELCYGYTSGETAIEAAERANAAAQAVEEITAESRKTLDDLERAVANVDDIVKVSDTQPTEADNKIWIQPQTDQEYKVATFEAYEALWNRCNEIAGTYQQGHGGIVSILKDEEYDATDETTGAVINRYVVTYSDGTTGEFFMKDGERGDVGPVDTIIDARPWYTVQTTAQYTGVLPTYDDPGVVWSDQIPEIHQGDYLWTVTVVTYNSRQQAYIYGLTRFGLDGSDGDGQVNTISIGDSTNRIESDDVSKNLVLPVDDVPTDGSNNLMTSGGIYEALQNASTSFENVELTGTPTAPTADIGTETDQIATTSFVRNEIKDLVPGYAVDGIWLLIATMNAKTLTYQNTWINDNVAAFCATSEPVDWVTSENQIVLTLGRTPTSPVTFPLLLVKRRA